MEVACFPPSTWGTTGRVKEQREEVLLFILSMERGRDPHLTTLQLADTNPKHTHSHTQSTIKRTVIHLTLRVQISPCSFNNWIFSLQQSSVEQISMLQKEDIFVSVMRQSYHVPCKISVFVVGRECQESPKKDAGSIRSTLTAYIWLSPFLSLS